MHALLSLRGRRWESCATIGSAVASRAGHGKDNALVLCMHAIGYSLPIMVAMCRLLRETYEPEQLTPSSTLKANPQGNALLEVTFWMVFGAAYSSWPHPIEPDCVYPCVGIPILCPFRTATASSASALTVLHAPCGSLHMLWQVKPSQGCMSRVLGISAACFAVQVGPRLSFQSAWSTNAVSICRSCGLDAILRLEVSRRFLLHSSSPLPAETVAMFAAMVCCSSQSYMCQRLAFVCAYPYTEASDPYHSPI